MIQSLLKRVEFKRVKISERETNNTLQRNTSKTQTLYKWYNEWEETIRNMCRQLVIRGPGPWKCRGVLGIGGLLGNQVHVRSL